MLYGGALEGGHAFLCRSGVLGAGRAGSLEQEHRRLCSTNPKPASVDMFWSCLIVLKAISSNWLQVINLRQSHFLMICGKILWSNFSSKTFKKSGVLNCLFSLSLDLPELALFHESYCSMQH